MHILFVAIASVVGFFPLVWQRYGLIGVPLLPFIASAFGVLAAVQLYLIAPAESEDGEGEPGL